MTELEMEIEFICLLKSLSDKEQKQLLKEWLAPLDQNTSFLFRQETERDTA